MCEQSNKLYSFSEDTFVYHKNYKHLIKKGAKASIVEYIEDDKAVVILDNDPFMEKIQVDKKVLI